MQLLPLRRRRPCRRCSVLDFFFILLDFVKMIELKKPVDGRTSGPHYFFCLTKVTMTMVCCLPQACRSSTVSFAVARSPMGIVRYLSLFDRDQCPHRPDPLPPARALVQVGGRDGHSSVAPHSTGVAHRAPDRRRSLEAIGVPAHR